MLDKNKQNKKMLPKYIYGVVQTVLPYFTAVDTATEFVDMMKSMTFFLDYQRAFDFMVRVRNQDELHIGFVVYEHYAEKLENIKHARVYFPVDGCVPVLVDSNSNRYTGFGERPYNLNFQRSGRVGTRVIYGDKQMNLFKQRPVAVNILKDGVKREINGEQHFKYTKTGFYFYGEHGFVFDVEDQVEVETDATFIVWSPADKKPWYEYFDAIDESSGGPTHMLNRRLATAMFPIVMGKSHAGKWKPCSSTTTTETDEAAVD